MRVLVVTDSFPPVCGGSGWSTWELARGLRRARPPRRRRARPKPGTPPDAVSASYDGIRVTEFGAPRPTLPYVRNYFKNERLWPALADALSEVITAERVDIVHAQHVMTCLPSIERGTPASPPVVAPSATTGRSATGRISSTTAQRRVALPGVLGGHDDALHPTARRAGLADRAWPLIPYMRANLARKRSGLAAGRCGHRRQHDDRRATCARARRSSPRRRSTRFPIRSTSRVYARRPRPRAADPGTVRALSRASSRPTRAPQHLVDIVERARLDWPLVIVGDGPDRATIEAQARRSGRDIRLVGWVDQSRDDGLARARLAARLPVTRPRVAEPRAHRGERARRTDRRDEHRRHARHREARRDRPALVDSGSAGRRRAAPGRTNESLGGASSAQRGRTTCRAEVRRRRRRCRRSKSLYRRL